MAKLGKVKLSDIAKEAGVSSALVSYVLNNRYPDRIKKETSERIKEIARKFNYRPNPMAKGLRTKKSNAIALILADLANPFSAQIARIIENQVIANGYILLIGSMDESIDKFSKLIDTFINHQVDGLIIVAPENSRKEIESIQSQGIPYVLVDRYFPELPFNYIVNDNYFAIYECVKNLIYKGRKSIGFITQDTNYVHFQERKRGFLDACNEFGIETEHRVLEAGLEDLSGNVDRCMATLLTKNPNLDAILFSTNVLTLYGLKYAVRNQLKVPEKVEIMGFDEAESYDVFPVPITYYKQPLEEIGKRSVDFLMSEIRHPGEQSIQEIIKGELVVTKSVTPIN